MKFRVLKIISGVLWVVGVIGGLLIFSIPIMTIQSIDAYGGQSIGRYGVPLSNLLILGIAGILFALAFIAVAELIALGLAIEDHLASSRRLNEQSVTLLEQIAIGSTHPVPDEPKLSSPVAPTPVNVASGAPVGGPPPSTPTLPPPTVSILAAEVSAENASVLEYPDVKAKVLGSVKQGRTLKLYGRDATGQWVCGDAAGTKWIHIGNLSGAGNLLSLPVITPPGS